jgi:hypothetical protein
METPDSALDSNDEYRTTLLAVCRCPPPWLVTVTKSAFSIIMGGLQVTRLFGLDRPLNDDFHIFGAIMGAIAALLLSLTSYFT